MSEDVIDHTIIFLEKKILDFIKNNPDLEEVEFGVGFFGGEPFICFDRVKYAVNKAKYVSERITNITGVKVIPIFNISTNGTLINENMAKFAAENNIEMIISIDGPDHDKFRIFPNKKGSLDKVIEGFRLLKKFDVLTRINSVVPANNVDNLPKRVDWFKKILLKEKPNKTYVTFSLVRGLVGNVLDKTNELNHYKYFHNYDDPLVDKFVSSISSMIKDGYTTYEVEMQRKIRMGGMFYRCLTGIERIAVMPDGSVYPCQSFVDEKFKFGSILDPDFDNLKSPIIQDIFLKRTIQKVEPCKDCWLQSICSLRFDCPSHSYYDHKGIMNIDGLACKIAYKILSRLLLNLIKNKVENLDMISNTN